jgi:hypothetical protein
MCFAVCSEQVRRIDGVKSQKKVRLCVAFFKSVVGI